LSLARPKNWKQINDARYNFYTDIFDDVNRIMDDLNKDVSSRIDKARHEIHDLMQEKAYKYGNEKTGE